MLTETDPRQIPRNFGVFSRGSWKFSAILTESVCKHLADNKIVALATFSFDNPVGKQHPETVSHRSRASFSYSLTLVRWINPLWVSGLETAAMAETHSAFFMWRHCRHEQYIFSPLGSKPLFSCKTVSLFQPSNAAVKTLLAHSFERSVAHKLAERNNN